MSDNNRFPEIIVFAGPNGSGKTTVTKLAKVIEPYINADDIKRTVHCSDLDAAVMAEKMREEALAEYRDFTFETVMSTDRNLNLLRRAKEQRSVTSCMFMEKEATDRDLTELNEMTFDIAATLAYQMSDRFVRIARKLEMGSVTKE